MPDGSPITPLQFRPDYERIEKDETQTGLDLIEALRKVNETTFKDYGHAVRAVHAKSHGCCAAI